MAWHDRRYSPWLLAREESLMRRRDATWRAAVITGVLTGVVEALLPWDTFTPDIPPLAHIAAAAVLLPVLYLMLQSDYRRKQQAFSLAMSELARRLFFLDPFMEPEVFEMQERLHGALLLPTQRALNDALRTAPSRSLRERMQQYFHVLPSPVCEEDRMGLLSFVHPRTALAWIAALALCWAGLPHYGAHIGTSQGLSVLPLLLPLYLAAARANSRFAYELSLFSWLNRG